MRIFICTGKHMYNKVPEVISTLEKAGHEITLPNSFEDPMQEERIKQTDKENHNTWKAEMFRLQNQKVEENDAILVLNYNKENQENYIGGSVLLEMFKAWELNKKIFLINPIPNNMLKDEIEGFNPIILNGNLSKIR